MLLYMPNPWFYYNMVEIISVIIDGDGYILLAKIPIISLSIKKVVYA